MPAATASFSCCEGSTGAVLESPDSRIRRQLAQAAAVVSATSGSACWRRPLPSAGAVIRGKVCTFVTESSPAALDEFLGQELGARRRRFLDFRWLGLRRRNRHGGFVGAWLLLSVPALLFVLALLSDVVLRVRLSGRLNAGLPLSERQARQWRIRRNRLGLRRSRSLLGNVRSRYRFQFLYRRADGFGRSAGNRA